VPFLNNLDYEPRQPPESYFQKYLRWQRRLLLPFLACLIAAVLVFVWQEYRRYTGDIGKWVGRHEHEILQFHSAKNPESYKADSRVRRAIRDGSVRLKKGDHDILLLAVTDGRRTIIVARSNPDKAPGYVSGIPKYLPGTWCVEDAQAEFGVEPVRKAMEKPLHTRPWPLRLIF
jgi:hypothetical protein